MEASGRSIPEKPTKPHVRAFRFASGATPSCRASFPAQPTRVYAGLVPVSGSSLPSAGSCSKPPPCSALLPNLQKSARDLCRLPPQRAMPSRPHVRRREFISRSGAALPRFFSCPTYKNLRRTCAGPRFKPALCRFVFQAAALLRSLAQPTKICAGFVSATASACHAVSASRGTLWVHILKPRGSGCDGWCNSRGSRITRWKRRRREPSMNRSRQATASCRPPSSVNRHQLYTCARSSALALSPATASSRIRRIAMTSNRVWMPRHSRRSASSLVG